MAAVARIPVSYHGPHPRPAGPTAAHVDWSPVRPPLVPARIREHTCECRPVLLELCSTGGILFVRRTDRSRARPVVSESEHRRAKDARELWHQLLTGRAR